MSTKSQSLAMDSKLYSSGSFKYNSKIFQIVSSSLNNGGVDVRGGTDVVVLCFGTISEMMILFQSYLTI